MYNKKLLSQIDLGKYKKPDAFKKDKIYNPTGKPIRDNKGQWKYPGQPTRIQSEDITMKGVPYPVMAYPNVGQPQMMYPNQEYKFPGADYVDEYPLEQAKKGGTSKKYSRSLEATNYLLRENPLFKKKKSKKKKIYDPNSPYFQEGGELPEDYQAFLDYSATAPENRQPGPNYVYGDPNDYDHYGMWQTLGKPKTFEEALEMNPDWQPDEYDGMYHGFSVNPNTGVFLKAGKPGLKEGDTTWMEIAGHYLSPRANESTPVFDPELQRFKYIPKGQKGLQVIKSVAPKIDDIIKTPSALEFSNIRFSKTNPQIEIKNPDYFKQLIDTFTTRQLSPSSKKMYTDVINSVKKQNNLATQRQYDLLQRLKTGNFNYGPKNFTTKGAIGEGTETGLTAKDIQAKIDENINWITSPEYLKRRSANTGETYAQIKADVDRIISNAENTKFNLNANLAEDISGEQIPNSLNTLWTGPRVNISKSTINPEMTLGHEMTHLYSPAAFNVPSYKLHKGFDNPNVATLPASERGVYANYPSLGDPTIDDYLQLGFEQQPRHLNARNQILSKYNLSDDAELNENQVRSFVDEWSMKKQDPSYNQDFTDLWDRDLNLIKRDLMKQTYGRDYPNAYFDILPEAERLKFGEEAKKIFSNKLAGVLNKAWMIPAGIGSAYLLSNPWDRSESNGLYQDGGDIELELTPEEIEEYKKGGYIVEEVDDPSIPELSKAQPGGQAYTYSGRPGSYYKKDSSGTWYIKNKNTDGKYIKMQDPTGSRSKILNAQAKPYTVDPYAAYRSNKVITNDTPANYDPLTDPKLNKATVASTTSVQKPAALKIPESPKTPKELVKRIDEYNKKTQEPKFEDTENYYKEYHNSPKYLEMLKASDPKFSKDIAFYRNANLYGNKDLKINSPFLNLPFTTSSSNFGESFDSGKIVIYPDAYNHLTTIPHEFSHAIDRKPARMYYKGKYDDYLYGKKNKLNEDKRLIPDKDISYITKNAAKTYFQSPEFYSSPKLSREEQLKNYLENPKAWESWLKKQEDLYKYFGEPTETRARLNTIRYLSKKKNIYDPFNQKVTPQVYKKLLNIKFDDARPLNELKRIYTDEEIMYMLNNISKNNNGDEQLLDKTQKGGQLPKAQPGAIIRSASNISKALRPTSEFRNMMTGLEGAGDLIKGVMPASVNISKPAITTPSLFSRLDQMSPQDSRAALKALLKKIDAENPVSFEELMKPKWSLDEGLDDAVLPPGGLTDVGGSSLIQFGDDIHLGDPSYYVDPEDYKGLDWRQEGQKDSYENFFERFPKFNLASGDKGPIDIGDFDFQQFSPGWQAQQELSNLASFGKQPLLNRGDFANAEERLIDKLFNKYGDDPKAMVEAAQAEGISPDAVLKRITTRLAYPSERDFLDRIHPFYIPENYSSSNRATLRNENYGQYKPFSNELNEYGPMGGKTPVSFGDFNNYYWDQIKRNEEFLSGDYNLSPEQRLKIQSRLAELYQKGLQGKELGLENPMKYTGYDAMRTLKPNRDGGEHNLGDELDLSDEEVAELKRMGYTLQRI
jgi:hypothetical protein